MSLFLRLFIISLLIIPIGCKKKESIEEIKETSLKLQMIDAYNQGMKHLETGQSLMAAKKFNEAELLFPQSKWAPKAALMSAYSYYDFSYYSEAIDEVDRFLKTYPNSRRKSYAHYIKAMSYYNQIVDEKKDLGPILEAKKSFQFGLRNFFYSKNQYQRRSTCLKPVESGTGFLIDKLTRNLRNLILLCQRGSISLLETI